jgi:site-specific recombinase XerD
VPPTAIVRRGKGGKGRLVPLPVEVAAAIDRYMRARKARPLRNEAALWLGDRGKGFSYDALHQTLVHRWLSKGGSEGRLMAVGAVAHRTYVRLAHRRL